MISQKRFMISGFLYKRFTILFLIANLFYFLPAHAQDTLHLSLAQVVKQGLDSSKTLRLSTAQAEEAIARWKQAKDARLPGIKINAQSGKTYFLTKEFQMEGVMKEPMPMPHDATMYMGTLSVNEPLFAGNRIRYAEKSAKLLSDISQMNAADDVDDVELVLIQSYINLYEIDENLKILERELQDVQGRVEEVKGFRDNGLAMDNDVLRFELQKAKVQLSLTDMQSNRMIANYTLALMLGLPDGVVIKTDSIINNPESLPSFPELISTALKERKELKILNMQQDLSSLQIKSIKGERLPSLGVSANAYYINPNSQFVPPQNSFLFPAMIGLGLNWSPSSLYTTKHKIEEAQIKNTEAQILLKDAADKIKTDVNRHYQNYLQNLEKIKVLNTAISQADENNRVMELRYKNQLITTTDRIDAQTLLYQSLINSNISKSEAAASYFSLLRAMGVLSQTKF